jgi:lipooligosaccharide transport system permease protein
LSSQAVDHGTLAARSRRWGAWQVAQRRFSSQVPFLHIYLLTAFGNPLIYLGAMGIGLGSLVKGDVAGVPYLAFVAPALVVSTIGASGAGWGMWAILAGFKWEKYYFAASATSVAPPQIAEGEAIAVGLMLLGQGVAFWALGVPFGAWRSATSLLIIPIAVLAGVAFLTPLMAYSATLDDEGLRFNVIQRLVVMPMFLFAGTFFPLESMPAYLRWIGWLSPMWHGTQLARIAGFGMAYPPIGVVGHLAFLVACALGGLAVARRTFHARLTR